MSFQSTRWLCQPGIAESASEFAILAVLAHHADAYGRGAYPSQRTIAEITGCSARTVRRKLSDLERRGIIRRGNQNLVSHFPPAVRPVVWDLAQGSAPAGDAAESPAATTETTPDTMAGVGHPVHGPRTSCPTPPDTGVRQSIINQSINHHGGEERERSARVKPLPENLSESTLSWTTPDNPRCRAHAHLQPHDHKPCGACGAVRREFERRADAVEAVKRDAAAARREAIKACPHCDENGMIQVAPDTVARCSHDHDAGPCAGHHGHRTAPRGVGAPGVPSRPLSGAGTPPPLVATLTRGR